MSFKLPRSWDFSLKMDMSKIVRSQSMMAVDPKGSGNWAPPSFPLERPLKAGWLKKQRSIVKNWQQRYFVLKGQCLYYYKDEEDLKPQGSVRLRGSTIKEVGAAADDAGKFIFEIIQGTSGDQNRMGQDSCVLMANSQCDMEEWVKALRRAVGSPLGVVFGQQLVETMVYEQRFGQHQVPILVEKCAEFIRRRGLAEEGIFRLPGQDNLVKQLRDAFDAGERPSFDRDTDVHTVASLFKLYLRELPEPVIPWTQYEDFLLCGQLLTVDESKGHQQLVKQLSLLPRNNYNLLGYICRFLYEIQENSHSNKMSVDNLATVFGVNLIRPKIEDPAAIMRGTPQIQKVMKTMISEHKKLFPASNDTVPSPNLQHSDSKKSLTSRSVVGWDAVQKPLKSKAGSRMPLHSKDNAETSTSELDLALEENGEGQPKNVLDTWTVEPRKRTQTLPNRKCYTNVACHTENPSVDRNGTFGPSFWPSSSAVKLNPDSSTSGNKWTSSQGHSELVDFSQSSSSSHSTSSGLGTRRETEKDRLTRVRDVSEVGSQISESPSSVQCGSTKGNSSAECKNSPPEDPEHLRAMIVDLKKEMERQKKDYEEQIKSLEKENYDVWAKVVRLNEALEKEKSRSVDLEQELQSIRCTQVDAEKQNRLLEDPTQPISCTSNEKQ